MNISGRVDSFLKLTGPSSFSFTYIQLHKKVFLKTTICTKAHTHMMKIRDCGLVFNLSYFTKSTKNYQEATIAANKAL